MRQRGALWNSVATLWVGDTDSRDVVSHGGEEQDSFYHGSMQDQGVARNDPRKMLRHERND